MDKKRRDKVKTYNRAFVRRLKLRAGCASCGYKKYHGALQFHHIDPSQKVASPSQRRAFQYNWSTKKIKNEIRKCEILCANCHAERHSNE